MTEHSHEHKPQEQVKVELTIDDYAQQCWMLTQENMMLRKHIKTLSEQIEIKNKK